jgi:L-ascorbate metabolism protein UlaG (beta-lactamase superfamily)
MIPYDRPIKEEQMRVRWLGWAGAEIEADGAGVVIDPLAEPGATFAALGEGARETQLPIVVAPDARSGAVAGLVSHLHRDHADAGALADALARDASVYEPAWPGGGDVENLGLAQANSELERTDLRRETVEMWERVEAGPFVLTALPAVDGLGDPQVSWLVEADGRRILHLGDTVFHGYWWRMARRHGPFDVVFAPINGAVVDFPHLQPPSPLAATMEPEQAALAGELLGAGIVVPMHYDGFEIEPWYRPVPEAAKRFTTAAAMRSYDARVLEPGEDFEVGVVNSSMTAATASSIADSTAGVSSPPASNRSPSIP